MDRITQDALTSRLVGATLVCENTLYACIMPTRSTAGGDIQRVSLGLPKSCVVWPRTMRTAGRSQVFACLTSSGMDRLKLLSTSCCSGAGDVLTLSIG
jgi:hypothetical protein